MGIVTSKNRYNLRQNGKTHQSETLTQQDLDLVKTSWNLVESKEDLGVEIMIRLFIDHSHLKSKWIFASNLETEDEMRGNSQLKYHAKNIINILGPVVEKVISAPTVESINIDECGLMTLGTKHFHFDVNRNDFQNFKPAFFNALKKQIGKKMKCGPKLKTSWFKVLDMVINQMANGVEQEAIDDKKRQENSRPF